MGGAFTHLKLHQDYLVQRRESLRKAVPLGCAIGLCHGSVKAAHLRCAWRFHQSITSTVSLPESALRHCASHTTEPGWG